jgi:hypothetical protein
MGANLPPRPDLIPLEFARSLRCDHIQAPMSRQGRLKSIDGHAWCIHQQEHRAVRDRGPVGIDLDLTGRPTREEFDAPPRSGSAAPLQASGDLTAHQVDGIVVASPDREAKILLIDLDT